MRAWLSLNVIELRSLAPADVAARLAYAQAARHGELQLTQRHAWEAQARILHAALATAPAEWRVLFEYDLLRLEKRIDVVLLTDRAILVLEFKDRQQRFEPADMRQAEDYAMDLYDFHAGSHAHPIVPVLVAVDAPPPPRTAWLRRQCVTDVLCANAATLGETIAEVHRNVIPPVTPLTIDCWEAQPYRPVPSVLEAASQLFQRNSVAEIAEARADAANLRETTAAIESAIDAARTSSQHLVVFVTGIPGAGKTLCGLNVVFGALREHGAAFLTGNVPLVTVLREALARNAAPDGGRAKDRAKDEARTALQNVHRFLETYVLQPDHLPESRVIVFDEAQRAWDAAQATKDTQRRVSRLTVSEPDHTLEIMGRHRDWAVVVALIGQGQEINTGEAGLAQWGRVIAASPRWRAVAAPRVLEGAEPAQQLATGTPGWLTLDARLDLTVPMRSVRENVGATWVQAVLDDDPVEAQRIAAEAGTLPFLLTRDLADMRLGLRQMTRGLRRAGLVASAGARRLRAEGLGVQVPEVADWFLNTWPDVRGSEALETFATEYDCQGLELDLVGLAWDGDFGRGPTGWEPRRFAGSRWQTVRSAEERRFIRNTYRVLLTRARYETIIWIPRGSPCGSWHDETRDAARYDAIAEYLLACGARPLSLAAQPAAEPAPTLV